MAMANVVIPLETKQRDGLTVKQLSDVTQRQRAFTLGYEPQEYGMAVRVACPKRRTVIFGVAKSPQMQVANADSFQGFSQFSLGKSRLPQERGKPHVDEYGDRLLQQPCDQLIHGASFRTEAHQRGLRHVPMMSRPALRTA